MGEVGPGRRGLSLRESELGFTANIDHMFRGTLIVALSPADGGVEVEEANIQTIGLFRTKARNVIATCRALRRVVFIEEQGVSEADEIDECDEDAIHLLARVEGQATGSARLLLGDGYGKIGRVCVLRAARAARREYRECVGDPEDGVEQHPGSRADGGGTGWRTRGRRAEPDWA